MSTELSKVIPDLLNRRETLGLGGVGRPYSKEEEETRRADTLRTLSMDGVYVSPKESPVAYGDQTPGDIIRLWNKHPQSWVYLYGGWANGMTLWVNIWHSLSLSEDIPLNQVKVRHIAEGLKDRERARIYYDYRSDHDALSGWRNMLQLKGIQVSQEEFEEMTLVRLLTQVGGAPTRWTMMVTLPEREEPLLPPTSSSPFPGAEYGNGFIASYLQPVFSEGETAKSICNSTGSRAVDSIALGNLIVRLRHDQQTAREKYIEDAIRRLEETVKRGAKPPYTKEDAERYAPIFVETQELVVEDILRILSKYGDEEIKGFQYAVSITSNKMLPTAMYKVSRARPYSFVKTSTSKGWKLAL